MWNLKNKTYKKTTQKENRFIETEYKQVFPEGKGLRWVN